jgi:MoaA/NifB/PqqE/SkfB family radical SAM enzyme
MITGHVVPCCAVLMSNNRPNLERQAFGNIYNDSLKEIWDTPYYKEFRKKVVDPHAPVPEVCVGCRAFNTLSRVKKYGVWKGYE